MLACSFKTFASGHQAAVLMSPEELSKIRETLLQAKQSAATEQKEASAAIAKQLAEAATADKPAPGVAGPGVGDATLEKPVADGVEPAASEGVPVKEEPMSATGAGEAAQPAVASMGSTGEGALVKAMEVSADGQAGDAMDIDGPELAEKEVVMGVTDEEVKAFWMSGVDAVVEVSCQSCSRLDPSTNQALLMFQTS